MSETANMNIIKYNARVTMKHDISGHWKQAENFIPLAGELIVYDDLRKIKIGNGTTKVNDLPFSSVDLRDAIGYTENGKNYPVELDNSGKMFVNVPWTDTILEDTNTTYDAGDGLKLTGTTFAVDCGEGLIIDEINKHLELNPAYTAIYYDPVFDDNGYSVITGRTGLMTPDQVYDLARATMLLNNALDYGSANKPMGFYKFSTTTYGFVQSVEPVTAEDIEGMEINTETSGASNTNKKIFLLGAETQDITAKTFTNKKAYIDKDGYVYSNNERTLTSSDLFDSFTNTIKSYYLPSYVDDIIEGYYRPFETTGAFIATDKTTNIPGEVGKIYVDIETNKTYRWSGNGASSRFVEISSGPLSLGSREEDAFRGDLGQIAYEHAIQGNDCTDYNLGLYKFETENGHITNVEGVTRDDIISYGLGYNPGTGILIDETTGTIALNTGYYATADRAGLMEAGDYRRLYGIEAGANKYVLPAATTTTLGGIKVGESLKVDANGVLSVDVTTHKHNIEYTPVGTVTFTGDTNTTSTANANVVVRSIKSSTATATMSHTYSNRCLAFIPEELENLNVALYTHTHTVIPTGTATFAGETTNLITSEGWITLV